MQDHRNENIQARQDIYLKTNLSLGKHGSAKVALVAVDIFTGKKYEEISPSSQNMDVPNVDRTDYQVVDISDDRFCSLMSSDGSTKDDLRLPPSTDIATEIESAFQDGKEVTVTVLKSMGFEQIISYKV